MLATSGNTIDQDFSDLANNGAVGDREMIRIKKEAADEVKVLDLKAKKAQLEEAMEKDKDDKMERLSRLEKMYKNHPSEKAKYRTPSPIPLWK